MTKYLAAFGVPEENFAVDLTIARGLDYYTGTVYETRMLDHPEIGAICAGGRYDNLAEYYSDRSLPGVGVAIGLTRLFYVLDEQGMLNPRSAHRPGRRAAAAHDGRPVPPPSRWRHAFRDAGHPHAALLRAEEVQGEDDRMPTSWASHMSSFSARTRSRRASAPSRTCAPVSRSACQPDEAVRADPQGNFRAEQVAP